MQGIKTVDSLSWHSIRHSTAIHVNSTKVPWLVRSSIWSPSGAMPGWPSVTGARLQTVTWPPQVADLTFTTLIYHNQAQELQFIVFIGHLNKYLFYEFFLSRRYCSTYSNWNMTLFTMFTLASGFRLVRPSTWDLALRCFSWHWLRVPGHQRFLNPPMETTTRTEWRTR